MPRRFPTLHCCYSNSGKEAAVLPPPHRNPPHALSFELSLPSFSNPNRWALETEEARTQAASVRPVQEASQASRTSRYSYRKLDWQKQCVRRRCCHRTIPSCWGQEGSRQHWRNTTRRDRGGDKRQIMYQDENGPRGAGLRPSEAMVSVWPRHTHTHTHTKHTTQRLTCRTALARDPVFHDFVKQYCTDVFFSFLIICPRPDFERGERLRPDLCIFFCCRRTNRWSRCSPFQSSTFDSM